MALSKRVRAFTSIGRTNRRYEIEKIPNCEAI